MTKKTHIIYALISICAIIAYGGFIVKNSISEVDTVEETLPYEKETATEAGEEAEAFSPPTEPAAKASEALYATALQPEESTETVTEESPTGFSPLFPVEGTVTKGFSLTHTYSEKTGDWRAHSGIDISAFSAEAVICVEDGTVTACYQDPLWGNVIEISHGEYTSIYKNLSTLIMVREGESVNRGEKISGVGSTGIAEAGGAHLHFELKHYSDYIDPLELLC